MSKEIYYYQCLLRKSNGEYRTVWLSEKYAIRNKILKIQEGDKWEEGWKVFNVYKDIKKSEKEAMIDANAYKTQRSCSDI